MQVESNAAPAATNSAFELKTRLGLPTSKSSDRVIDRFNDLLGVVQLFQLRVPLLKRHHFSERGLALFTSLTLHQERIG